MEKYFWHAIKQKIMNPNIHNFLIPVSQKLNIQMGKKYTSKKEKGTIHYLKSTNGL